MNILKKMIVLLTVVSLIFLAAPDRSEASAQPSLASLKNNYEVAVQKMFYWSSLNAAFSKGGLANDIAAKAYIEYQKLTLLKGTQYTKKDFINDVNVIAKTVLQNKNGQVTAIMKLSVKVIYLSASQVLTIAEKELKKYYPNEAAIIINAVKYSNGGSGAGVAAPSW